MKKTSKTLQKKVEKTQKQGGDRLARNSKPINDLENQNGSKISVLRENIMALGENDPTLQIGILLNKMKKMRSGSFILSGRKFESLFNGNIQIRRNDDKTFITFLGQRTVLILKD